MAIPILSIFFLVFMFKSHAQSTSLSFNFTNFPNAACTSDIRISGNASCFDSLLILTDNGTWRTGHAVYSRPFRLWDNSSSLRSLLVADFTTEFSFSIDAGRNDSHGDGLAFYLSNLDYQIPSGRTGGAMGLAPNNMSLNSSSNPFVAIEFDTFGNEWDVPHEEHVGVDISSAISVKTARWNSSLLDGRRLNARIAYNSASKNLCVHFPGYSDSQLVVSRQELCHELDLTDYLKEWVNVGFSSSTGEATEVHKVHSWSFSSNLVARQTLAPPPLGSAQGVRRKDYTAGIAIGVAVGIGSCFTILLLCGLGLFIFWRNKHKKQRGNKEIVKVNGARNIPRESLDRATNNFSEDEKLGEGGFGAVFRGYLDDLNMFVAVKRILRAAQGVQEYANEIMIISQLRHKNLVQLIGWCHEKRELLLVYEYMENRSLDFHIFDEERLLLDWNKRYKVAQGLASALHYLHEECNQCVLHRDIKANNVMLDAHFNPKLGDFGLARLVDHDAASQTLLGGTRGYMAPECLQRGKTSRESDVYGFGVVALELATGRKPFVELEIEEDDDSDFDTVHIARWVWKLYGRGKLLDGVECKLGGEFDEKQAECLMVVGMWCCHPNPRFRPSIRVVMDVLSFSSPLPNLPIKFPGSSLHSTPSETYSSFSLSTTIPHNVTEENYRRKGGNTITTNAPRDGLSVTTDGRLLAESSTDPFIRTRKGRGGPLAFPRNAGANNFDSV
ncbi:L-type lectin-domain containing receptor kinase IX.1 [Linum perenne]